jgi:hypothetical protein
MRRFEGFVAIPCAWQPEWKEICRLARLGAAVESMPGNSMLCRYSNASAGNWWTFTPQMGVQTDARGATPGEVLAAFPYLMDREEKEATP